MHALRHWLANGIQNFVRVVQLDTCASSCTRCHPPTVSYCHGLSLPPPPPPSPVRAAVVGTALRSVANSRTAKAPEKPEYPISPPPTCGIAFLLLLLLSVERLEVTYSYWDGSGHRREIVLNKGVTVGACGIFCVFSPWRFIFCRERLRCTQYPPAVRTIDYTCTLWWRCCSSAVDGERLSSSELERKRNFCDGQRGGTFPV